MESFLVAVHIAVREGRADEKGFGAVSGKVPISRLRMSNGEAKYD